MDNILVVSPHLDDAVLSCGQFIGSYPEIVVLTIFAGIPEDAEQLTSYDETCGFTSAREAMYARWAEDDRALDVLDARSLRTPQLDHQYDPDRDPVEVQTEVATLIRRAVAAVKPCRLVLPLGLAHPDHEIVAAAGRQAFDPDLETWVYEDVPSRVLWPEQVPPALDLWATMSNPTLAFMGGCPLDTKKAAVRCYTSQLGQLDEHVLFVPERTWRLWPA